MLEDAGFDISDPDHGPSQETLMAGMNTILSDKRRKHIKQCLSCHEEGTLGDTVPLLLQNNVGSPSSNNVCRSTLDGSVGDPGALHLSLGPLHDVSADDVPHFITLSVGGMTCSSCSGTITEMVSQLPGISEVVVNLLNNSATVVVARRDLIGSVTETIEDCGFEVDVINVEPLVSSTTHSDTTTGPRNLLIRVDGMYCQYADLIISTCMAADSRSLDIVQQKS